MDNLTKNREELMKQINEMAGHGAPEGYSKLILPAVLAGTVMIIGLLAAGLFTLEPKVQSTMFATSIEGQGHQVEVVNTRNEFN